MFSVSQKEKIFFAEHLSLMIKGGIPINEAIETLRDETKSQVFKKSLEDILKKILEGQRLNKTLESHPRIFDKFFCNVVKVGEESGTLEENLKYLAQQLKSDYEMKRKVRGALIYPFIIIGLALIVGLTITLFVLPKIIGLFQVLEIELPLATRILINVTSFLKRNFIFLIIGAFLLSFIFKILQRSKLFKFYFDKISLSLPFLNQIFQNLNLSRFSRTSYTLLKSGMPILESLDICIDIQSNEVFKKNLILVKLGVERGEKISQGLKKSPKFFPSMFSQMITIGEKSGALEESFLYLSNFYEGEVESTLKNLSEILEPVLLILVGIFVAFVALATIIPIYRFVGALRFR
jgi:type IV pilus assembly protein PilC